MKHMQQLITKYNNSKSIHLNIYIPHCLLAIILSIKL